MSKLHYGQNSVNDRNNPVQLPIFSSEEPVFADHWQAQVLAMANLLIKNGQFSAEQWSQRLGSELRRAAEDGQPDNKETFYLSALNALESLTVQCAGLSTDDLNQKTQDWYNAHLNTPHGKPVELSAN